MARSPLQSDFVVHHARPRGEDIAPPPTADAVELPRAVVRTTEASARATKLVLALTFVMLAILALMCAIGPHIPAGE